MKKGKKRIKRLCPVPLYSFSSLEYWLTEMARKGYILQEAKNYCIFFEKQEVQDIFYHVEDVADDELCLAPEQEEARRAENLVYVCTISEKGRGYCHIYIDRRPEGAAKAENRGSERIFRRVFPLVCFARISWLLSLGIILFASGRPLIYWLQQKEIKEMLAVFLSLYICEILLSTLQYLDYKKVIFTQKGQRKTAVHIYQVLEKMSYVLAGGAVLAILHFTAFR